jgi:hypothetical protein
VGADRKEPRIATEIVLRALAVMGLGQMGSLNALGQHRGKRGWKAAIGGELPSARTTGRVMAGLDCDGLRQVLRSVYSRRKRSKSLKAFVDDLVALVVDGHESSASYRRCCPQCLTRTIHTAEGDRTQYYHRLAAATLLFEKDRMPVDCEMQRPGEDEVACAIRLLERLLLNCPRAFQIVAADGLYLRADFFNLVTRHGKHAIAVLKDERRDLMKDARGLFDGLPQTVIQRGHTRCECWDIDGFTSWPGLDAPARVVRSVETSSARRQIGGQKQETVSEWIWGMTIPKTELATEGILRFGHGRWSIENEGGFNELVNVWHADHVYKHASNAILGFWLITMLVFNLFHAFINRNLKAVRRAGHTAKYFLDLISAEFHLLIRKSRAFAPS